MNAKFDRRNFIRNSATAIGGLTLGGLSLPAEARAQAIASPGKSGYEGKTIRLGFVGVGGRGSYHLDSALGIPGVEVPAICDIKDANLYRAKQWIEEAGQPTPRLYNRSETDFKRLCEEEELDAVICATSWKWHAPVCLAAMKNNKNAVSEVPIILIPGFWQIPWGVGYWCQIPG